MALIIAEALRRTLKDLAQRVQPYRLAISAAGFGTLGIAVLGFFGFAAFLLTAGCMFVAGTFGGLAGFDLARSRYAAELERAERDAARLAAELYVHATTIEAQRRVIAKRDEYAQQADELAASHLAELNRLRAEVSGG